MSHKHILAVAVAISFMASSAHAERWMVSEGLNGEWRGMWILNASSGNFPINLRMGNQSFNAEGFYIRSGNTVSIARTKSSDGNDCHYFGTISGRTISGVSFCASGGPNPWTARIEDR